MDRRSVIITFIFVLFVIDNSSSKPINQQENLAKPTKKMSLPKASINDNNNKLKNLSTLRSSSFGAVNMIHSNALHHNTNKKQIPRGSRDMRKQKVQKVQKITENLLCIMVDPKSDSNKKGSRINTIFSSHNWGS